MQAILTEGLQSIWVFVKLLARNYVADGCQSSAAALTYQTLFAVVPLLTITFTVLSAFQALSGVGDTLQSFVFDNVVPEAVSVVQGYLYEFSEQARSLSMPSLIVVAVTAFLMMFTIEKSFNEIWRIQEPRRGFQRILMYWAILTLGPVFMGIGIIITSYLLSLPLISDVTVTSGLLGVVPIFLNTMLFSMMYVAVPNCVVPLRHGLIGGLVVAVLFELVKRLFGTVMAQTDFQVIYGTYAAVPLFLIWLYMSWTIVLFGAELTKNMGLFRSQRSPVLEPPLLQVLIVLHAFFKANQRGEVVTEQAIAALGHRVDLQAWHDYKARLMSIGVITAAENGGLVLSRDLAELSFWQLYQALPWPLPHGFNVPGNADWEDEAHRSLANLFEHNKDALIFNLDTLFRESKK